jgi:hypothetical protein
MFSAEKKCRLLLAVSQSLGGSGAMMYTEGKVYEEGLAAVVL